MTLTDEIQAMKIVLRNVIELAEKAHEDLAAAERQHYRAEGYCAALQAMETAFEKKVVELESQQPKEAPPK